MDQALEMSWERLNALTAAHRRRDINHMLQLMVAAQGDDKSWKDLRKHLIKQYDE